MEEVRIDTEYIKLEQLLKWAGIVDSGGDAKTLIAEGLIKVNGSVELQRVKKIRKNDVIEIDSKKIKVVV